MKVAVITGAASGIGLALCKIYLKQGIDVVMVDKNQSALLQASETSLAHFKEKVHAVTCDITDVEAVNLLADEVHTRFGRVDYLYNNAGIMGELVPLWDLNLKTLHQMMDVNLFGMIHMIQAFCPFLFKQDFKAHIVNVSSLFALCSSAQTAAYTMSKHAVLALSESLYFDFKTLKKPVDVSVVFPSFTDTALLNQNASAPPTGLHEALKTLLTHSKKAEDVAEHIVQAVDKKQFYILPDREVKSYCEERVQSIIMQEDPHVHSIQKLMNSLVKRQG